MSKPFILLTEHIHPKGLELLAGEAYYEIAQDAAEVARKVSDADALLTRNQRVGADVIEMGARLRVIGRHGVGLDAIDLDAATSRRIPVVYTPEANALSVAEYVIAAIFTLARRMVEAHQAQSAGNYNARHHLLGMELEGRILGLVGCGRIGSLVARKAHALGLQVWAYDPAMTAERAAQAGIRLCSSLEEVLRGADFVSLHTPLLPSTRKLMNAERLAMLKPTAYLINAARGPVVDEAALVNALRAGSFAGAAIDVFDPEPPAPDNPLLTLPNVIVTPHTAASTNEAMVRMAVTLAEEVLAALKGARPRYLANAPVWEDRRYKEAIL